MNKIEERFKEEMCCRCNNTNADDCNIKSFVYNNCLYCKCTGYKGNLKSTQIKEGINS